jgi:hypothetical protein
LAFVMREDLAYEWRRLRRAVGEPEWGSYWPENRDGIGIRMRLRIAHRIAEINRQLKWRNFRAAISRRSSVDKHPNPESVLASHRPASIEVQDKASTAQLKSNPLPSRSPEPPSQQRTIFPGSSPTDAAHSKSKPWDESEWID